MIPCSRAVCAATTDDNQPPSGSSPAEALQFAPDPGNVKRLVANTVKKKTSKSVIVRVKTLLFLVPTEAITDRIGFGGHWHFELPNPADLRQRSLGPVVSV
jgi:hypothetical protein